MSISGKHTSTLDKVPESNFFEKKGDPLEDKSNRVRQVFLISDKATDNITNYLISSDKDFLSSDCILDIESLMPPCISLEKVTLLSPSSNASCEMIEPGPLISSPVVDLINGEIKVSNLATNFFWTPIFVIVDPEDSNAAELKNSEIDSFNTNQFKEAKKSSDYYQKDISWNRILLNPNAPEITYTDFSPISLNSIDPSMLKYLGGHLANLESISHDTEEGFEMVERIKRVSLGSPIDQTTSNS